VPEHRRSDRGRRGLFARVIERRRLEKTPTANEEAASRLDEGSSDLLDRRIASLESRLDHLESLVEGLQDAVHRDSARHEREIRDLEERTAPGQMSRSLAEHDREHGL
jgi:uncharacterized coiled-coil protein SlyX